VDIIEDDKVSDRGTPEVQKEQVKVTVEATRSAFPRTQGQKRERSQVSPGGAVYGRFERFSIQTTRMTAG
jgi:hypothetical protein